MSEDGPKTPRALARAELDSMRKGEVSLDVDFSQEAIKSEIYGIIAYFIEKITIRAQQWRKQNPTMALSISSFRQDNSMRRSDVIGVSEHDLIGANDSTSVLRGVGRAIGGLLEYHILETMNDIHTPEFVVNPADALIQERLEKLLSQSTFRSGAGDTGRDMVLSAVQAPKIFIPTVYHAGLEQFHKQFGRFPDKDSDELDELSKKMQIIILQLSQFHMTDMSAFIRKHFFATFKGGQDMLPVSAFDSIIELKVTEKGYTLSIPEIASYETSEHAKQIEPTVGCPAIYARSNGQNVIKEMCDYATELLERSGLYGDTR